MEIFIKDIKKNKFANAFDMSENGKKVFGLWISVKEPKNENEFAKMVQTMKNYTDDELEPIALISDNFYAFKYDNYLIYSNGKYFCTVDDLKKNKEEIKI